MVAFVLMLCTNCNPDTDRLTDGLAIDMSVQIPQTKAMAKSVLDLQNSAIGIYGYKQQLTDADKKFLVFDNEKLEYQSNTWGYSPVRYWDTQTEYSYIAYSPYSVEDVTVNGFTGITISNVPQWQNADAPQSKDYIVALSDSAAVDYINGGGRVKMAFHHILANLQISAYYEGNDADFVITGLTLGADTCKLPAVDTIRSYSQNFGSERADGSFSAVYLEAASVQITENGYNYTVSKSLGMAANFLVAPFSTENGKQIPLTITYTENGELKTATVNTGITQFESDNVYTLTLKFKTTEAPVGPSGPGVDVILNGFAIGDGHFNYCLAVSSEGDLMISNINSTEIDALIWIREYSLNSADKFLLTCYFNDKKYYLTAEDEEIRYLRITENADDALSFYMFQYPDKNPNLVTDIDSVPYLVKHTQDYGKEILFFLSPEDANNEIPDYYQIAPSEFTKLTDFSICNVEDSIAGPLIYFNPHTNRGYDYLGRVMDYNLIQSLSFSMIMREEEFSVMSFVMYNENLTNFYYDGAPNVNTIPNDNLLYQSDLVESVVWEVLSADETELPEGSVAIMANGNAQATLTYNSVLPNDTNIVVSATVNFTDGREPRVAKYGLILKGQTN